MPYERLPTELSGPFWRTHFTQVEKWKKRTKTHNFFNMNLSITYITRNMFLIKKRCLDYILVLSMYFIKTETFQSNDTLK